MSVIGNVLRPFAECVKGYTATCGVLPSGAAQLWIVVRLEPDVTPWQARKIRRRLKRRVSEYALKSVLDDCKCEPEPGKARLVRITLVKKEGVYASRIE